MQLLPRLRRAAAVLIPSLLVAGMVHQDALARTQEANVISVVPLSISTVEEAPANFRGGLLLATDGNFYGISLAGGKSIGAIARITPAGVLTVVHSLQNSDEGYDAYAGMMQAADGNFYGTTFHGGEKGGGVVYRLTPDGTYTVLRHLGENKLDAYFPYTGLVQAGDGNLYGTSLRGGTNDKGTIFRISLPDNQFTLLHSFSGADGENPEGTLIVGADGNLYGTTLQGGSDSRGTIYRLSIAGSAVVTSLYSFPSLGAFNDNGQATNATGANPRAGLLLAADGNFYGTAYQGGPAGWGTLFRMTPAGAVTLVHSFTGPLAGGAYPQAPVVQDADGNLYGTTEMGGGLHRGTAWRVSPAGQFNMLHSFTGGTFDGSNPWAPLLITGGKIYGVSMTGNVPGSANAGAVFQLDLGTSGVLPVELSVSPTEITVGASATLTWSAAAGSTSCATSMIPGTTWSDNPGTSGSLSVTPATPGPYTYMLTCTDAASVVRTAYAALPVKAPPSETVDGGEGGGALSVPVLLLLGALALRKKKF